MKIGSILYLLLGEIEILLVGILAPRKAEIGVRRFFLQSFAV